ncbi:hypothetical protein FH715_19880 [Streptomyces sedi]|uniref:Uncharacterized protein n=1 Tax=Streptomyces sedi TaxID=555059 RepID=A0A5C4UVM7_9ACTN|nr:hypothetical protein FH715_19880 [Streptomyces sedi]
MPPRDPGHRTAARHDGTFDHSAALDEPATARAPAGFPLRGPRRGAFTEAESYGRTGLTAGRPAECAAPRPAPGRRQADWTTVLPQTRLSAHDH